MENSMEAPQKTKKRSAMQSSNTIPGNISEGKKCQVTIQTPAHTCILHIAVLLTVVKLRKQPRCPSTDERTKKM
jgi:hypothetical protein